MLGNLIRKLLFSGIEIRHCNYNSTFWEAHDVGRNTFYRTYIRYTLFGYRTYILLGVNKTSDISLKKSNDYLIKLGILLNNRYEVLGFNDKTINTGN